MSRSVIGYDRLVPRWEPDAAGRLQAAALALFAERGYDATTAADVAERAGLTRRTFFRHFPDKREVLFSGSGELFECFLDAVDASEPSAPPFGVVAKGLDAAAALLQQRRDFVLERQRVIDAHPELQERERSKLAALVEAIADALRRRGVDEPAASLAGEAGVAVLRVAFDRWVAAKGRKDLRGYVHEALDELLVITASGV
jgi:AcrR family transcriptional regulator